MTKFGPPDDDLEQKGVRRRLVGVRIVGEDRGAVRDAALVLRLEGYDVTEAVEHGWPPTEADEWDSPEAVTEEGAAGPAVLIYLARTVADARRGIAAQSLRVATGRDTPPLIVVFDESRMSGPPGHPMALSAIQDTHTIDELPAAIALTLRGLHGKEGKILPLTTVRES